jgi:hypothetical protein
VEYSVGFALDERARAAIGRMAASAWQHVLDGDGRARDVDEAAVVELTGLLREQPTALGGDALKAWPAGMRVIVRRERPHPGAQLSLFEEADGYRYQLFATNTPPQTGRLGQIAFLQARHRATPASRTTSGPARTPAWVTSRRSPSRSTRPGAWPSEWPVTCSRGCGCCA